MLYSCATDDLIKKTNRCILYTMYGKEDRL